MKKKLYRRLMSFALVTSLVFGNIQITVLAAQNEYNSKENEMSQEAFVEEITELNTEEAFVETINIQETIVEECTNETVINTEVSTEETTEVETEASTKEATEVETEVSTEEATEVETEVLTEEATEAETEILTEEATEAETEILTEEATEAETEVLTEEATEVETEVLTEETTEIYEMEIQFVDTASAETPESDFTWSGTTIVKYNGSDKEVIIPEKAQKIDASAFKSNNTIESVTIGKNVTSIGSYAFENCINLKSVTFNTNKIKRENAALSIFYKCSINKLSFAEGTTYIPGHLFYNAGFEPGFNLVIPKEVEIIEHDAFSYCSNIGSITFEGKFETNK